LPPAGGGKRALPDGLRIDLELTGEKKLTVGDAAV
jgi:hypothetical protein